MNASAWEGRGGARPPFLEVTSCHSEETATAAAVGGDRLRGQTARRSWLLATTIDCRRGRCSVAAAGTTNAAGGDLTTSAKERRDGRIEESGEASRSMLPAERHSRSSDLADTGVEPGIWRVAAMPGVGEGRGGRALLAPRCYLVVST